MVKVSENLRNLINADSRSFKARLKNGDNTYEQIISLKRSVVFPSSSMSIGNALSACVECTVSDIPVSITGAKMQIEITIHESAEWIKLGSFTAEKPTVQDGNVTFTAYDDMASAANKTYKSTLSEGEHTAQEYFYDICSVLDAECVPLDESLRNLTIPENKLSGYSCRDALAYLAGYLGRNCIVNRDGAFEMISFKAVDYDMLNIDRIAEPELSDADSIIGYLACCIDEETTLQSGTGSTGSEFISPLMTQERLDELYNQLCGETSTVRVYKAGKIKQILGDPTIDICDVISLNYDDEVYTIPVMSLMLDFDGGLQAEIESFDLAEPNSLSLGERLSFEQKQAKEKTDAYINSVVEFSQAIQKAYGVSNTEINGITYFHDTEEIKNAKYIYCMTSKGIAFTNSWGGSHEDTVWKYGLNSEGEAFLNMLNVFHIKADLIEAGIITSVDGSTYFDLNKGQFGTTVTETDENGVETIKYSYNQDAEGVYLTTGLAVTYEEFESNMTDEEKAEIAKEEAKFPGTDLSSVLLKTVAVAYKKYKLWRKRLKGYEVSSYDVENGKVYNFNFSGNKAFFSYVHADEDGNIQRNVTEFSIDGIKSNKGYRIDAAELDVAMTYYANTDNTFETTLTKILSAMTNTSYKHIQFYDQKGLYDNKFIGTLWRYTGNYGVIEAVSYSGLSARKRFYNGVWEPWEWINPPMTAGTAYRTTERYNGKPVYVQCGTIAALPATSTMTFTVGVSGDVIADIVQISAIATDISTPTRKYPFPFISTSGAVCSNIILSGKRTFTVRTFTDLSGYSANYMIKYTLS